MNNQWEIIQTAVDLLEQYPNHQWLNSLLDELEAKQAKKAPVKKILNQIKDLSEKILDGRDTGETDFTTL